MSRKGDETTFTKTGIAILRRNMRKKQNYDRQMDVDLGAVRKAIKVGQRVRVRQPICTGRNTKWQTDVTGTVLDVDLGDTGAWYAHSITGHLQLVRIRVRKDNGEVSELNLDPLTRIEHVNSKIT